MIIFVIALVVCGLSWLNHDAEKESYDYKKYF